MASGMSLYEAVLEVMRRRRRDEQPSMSEEQARESVKPRKSNAVLDVGPRATPASVLRSLGPGPGRDGHGE
jgi:hypothetical protein